MNYIEADRLITRFVGELAGAQVSEVLTLYR
jgi:hypothetical protein